MNASVVVLASNLHVETVRIITQSTESKHLVTLEILGGSFAKMGCVWGGVRGLGFMYIYIYIYIFLLERMGTWANGSKSR